MKNAATPVVLDTIEFDVGGLVVDVSPNSRPMVVVHIVIARHQIRGACALTASRFKLWIDCTGGIVVSNLIVGNRNIASPKSSATRAGIAFLNIVMQIVCNYAGAASADQHTCVAITGDLIVCDDPVA